MRTDMGGGMDEDGHAGRGTHVTTSMDEDAIWRAIDAQRLALADLLDQLTDEEWRRPSLCDGWTVRDVAAHLNLQQVTLADVVAQVIRAPRGLNRTIHDTAVQRAALPTERLTQTIRDVVGSRRHNVGVTCRETLVDISVHCQDIAVPLGRALPVPVEAAAVAASRVWHLRWPFRAKKRFAGFRLVATDVPWAVGAGLRVEGPIEAVLLVLTGRLVALPRLAGPGLPDLRDRLPQG